MLSRLSELSYQATKSVFTEDAWELFPTVTIKGMLLPVSHELPLKRH